MSNFYYYTSAGYLRENLKNRRLKVSSYSKLNDPFELAPFDISDRLLRERHETVMGKFSETLGLICMSETWQSPAMWAHYAENHQGACLELELTDMDPVRISYSDKKLFPNLTVDEFCANVDINNIRNLFGTKSRDWSYEREHRLHISFTNEHIVYDGEYYFLKFFSDFQLKRIYVGMNCTRGIRNIQEDVEDYAPNVEVVQTRPAFDKFEVVEQEDMTLWQMDAVSGDD